MALLLILWHCMFATVILFGVLWLRRRAARPQLIEEQTGDPVATRAPRTTVQPAERVL